jgi:multidrug efflux pump
VPVAFYGIFLGAMQVLNPGYLFGGTSPCPDALQWLPGAVLFVGSAILSSIALGAARIERAPRRVEAGYRRTPFGRVISFIAGNPVMPVVVIALVIAFVMTVFTVYGQNNRGVEFFVESEPEQAIVYVRARGNLSLAEKDALVAQAEEIILDTPGVQSAFAFAGAGGLNSMAGSTGPRDAIGQVQIELVPWEDRAAYARDLDGVTAADLDGNLILAELERRLSVLPGIQTEILNLSMGPASPSPCTCV